MKIADLLKSDLAPVDVQGLFEDVVYELTNPHCRNEEGQPS